MSQNRSKAFVIHDYGDMRESAFQTTQERLDIGHTFRVAVIHLFGVTDNKKIYFSWDKYASRNRNIS